jgi:hypothetical protein
MPEITAAEAPKAVVASARRASGQRGKRADCNRFFQGDDIYLIVLSSFCGGDFGKEADSRQVVAVSLEGTVIGEISWISRPGIAELDPYMRFQSRPASRRDERRRNN